MPIGYRFCPTDEEIIIHYLRPKVFNFPLPATVIHHHHHHLFTHHPAHLPGNPKEKRYFFCKTSDTTQQYSLNIPSGYWKPIVNNNTHKLILASGCNHPIGFKKSFVFFEFSDHRKSGTRTPWILHQFRLLYPLPIKTEECMVCSIHMKTKKVKKQHQPPTKKHKRSHTNSTNDIVEIEDDLSSSSSGITFNDDLDNQKEEEDNDDEIKS
uniref:NAC domain-containing protein 83-like n=1 Tax=Erigeron canadensis TaxID=72917 RepID=UPI001CB8CD5B|nr:NAC domain-containing protein 83-like [Erigeron canadensis]